MDRRLMFMKIILTPGGCLPMPWGYIHVYDHNTQTSYSLKAKLYVEHHKVGGMKHCIEGQGHMTKIAAMSINSKNI